MSIKNSPKASLILLIFVAFILGLGNPFYDHTLINSIGDEFESQRVALEILNSQSLIQSSYYLPLWAWFQLPFLGLCLLFLRIFTFSSLETLKAAVIFQPGMLLPLARTLSALISALGVFWTYRIGKLLGSKRVGLLSSLFYALSFSRIILAHTGKVSSLFLFFNLGFIYFIIKLTKTNQPKYLALSFIFVGLATATYPLGLVLFLVPFCLLLVKHRPIKAVFNRLTMVTLTVTVNIVALLVYLTPGIINVYLPQIETTSNPGIAGKLFSYGKLLLNHELPFVVLGIPGLLLLFKQKRQYFWALVIFGIISFLPFLFKNTIEPRYLILLVIPFLFASAFFTEKILAKFLLPKSLLLGFILTYPFLLVMRFNVLEFRQSTYLQAKNWLEVHTSREQKILATEDDYGLIPTEEAASPIAAKNPRYHQSQTALLSQEEVLRQEVKNIQYLADLEAYLSPQELDNHLATNNYSLIVLSFFNQDKKTEQIQQIDFDSYRLTKSFYPAPEEIKLQTLLTVANPFVELFSRIRFGPYIEIYEKK